ncbi:hypothetical protein [Streptomyces sp. NPDC050388]|uniref:hypothetical protein n=1 Tax=Streptomyces sp. NPDC050388 TaxID=3155781 RepID=UPI00342ADB04
MTEPADRTALRDRIANAIGRIPFVLPIEHRRKAADEVLAVLPEPAEFELRGTAEIRAAALREAADRYATLVDQSEAYEREQGQLDEVARLQYGTVRDVVIGLRRLADETPAAEAKPATFADGGVNDIRELYALHAVITATGGELTPPVHRAIDDLRGVWDRELRREQERRAAMAARQGRATP